MERPIKDGLERFAQGQMSLFGNPKDAFSENQLNDPHFCLSAFCVYLAINSFNVAIDSYGSAVTEGYQERGFDGIAISIADQPLTGENQAEAVAQAHLSDYLQRLEEGEEVQPPKVKFLMIQVKSKDQAMVPEIDYLGNSTEKFFTTPNFPAEFHANEAVNRWWKIYQSVKTVFANNEIPLQPKIDMLFVYMGQNLEERPLNQKSSNYCKSSLERHLGGTAEVNFTLWRQGDVIDAIALADQSLDAKLENASLLPLPSTAATGYLGYCPASSISKLIPIVRSPGENNSRPDDRAFSDNVRSFRGLEKNPGAVGLSNSLIDGEGDQVLLRHNGITIVTRGVQEEKIGDNLYNLHLQSFQIVNGAQSSFILHQHKGFLENVYITIKIVITESQQIKDGVVLGANSQLNVSDFDMLARFAEIRALQQAFNVYSSDRVDKLWFKRLTGERFHTRPKRFQTVTPRQLLEAYVATIEAAPHSVHAGASKLLLKVPKQVFRRDHHPSVYRALGWLLATGRRWAKENQYLWVDQVRSDESAQDEKRAGGKEKYGARHQFVYALWHLVDPTPNDVSYENGRLSHKSLAVEKRFETICELLSDPDQAMEYANRAAEAVQSTLESGSISNQVRLKPFTARLKKNIESAKLKF